MKIREMSLAYKVPPDFHKQYGNFPETEDKSAAATLHNVQQRHSLINLLDFLYEHHAVGKEFRYRVL
jgi:hypothetical protein